MNTKISTFRLAAAILIALGGLGLLVLALNALSWAPWLLSSVSWNA